MIIDEKDNALKLFNRCNPKQVVKLENDDPVGIKLLSLSFSTNYLGLLLKFPAIFLED
jgi:hypothetical protein